ncbi:MAG: hypothetical protein JNJ61_16595 [Anaerolineae bacterium]|nr:hypothetical protein [Anaerolineae bacterium]
MNIGITEKLFAVGLIQYGRFQVANRQVPFRLLLDYLPAHPEMLGQLAQAVLAYIPQQVDRILVGQESLPLGVMLCVNSGKPLIYSRGQGEDAAFDLVGAYNSGHRAVLVTTVLDEYDDIAALVARAGRVGLVVEHLVALISVRQPQVHPDLTLVTVLQFGDITRQLGKAGRIPDAHVRTTLDWLAASR